VENILQVNFQILFSSGDWKLTLEQKDLEASVMIPEPLLVPFTNKGKEVSFYSLQVVTRTEN